MCPGYVPWRHEGSMCQHIDKGGYTGLVRSACFLIWVSNTGRVSLCHCGFFSWAVTYVFKGKRQVSVKVRDTPLEVTS